MEWYIKKFQQLTLNELYEILKQRINVFVVEQNCPYFECDDKDLNSIHIFARDKANIVAYLRVLPPGVSYEEASIGRVLVHKKYRGRGIAGELLNKAIQYIKDDLKQTSIRISAQEYLVKFYSSLGFKIISDTYLEDGIFHVEMLAELNHQ